MHLLALARAFSSSAVIFCFAMTVVVWRKWRRMERVVEEIGYDEPNKGSQQTQTPIAISHAAAGL
jgi:hypothetical protein